MTTIHPTPHTQNQLTSTANSRQTSIAFFNPKPHNVSNNSELKEFFQRYPNPNDFLRAYPVSLQYRILTAGLTPSLLADKQGIPSLALLINLYGEPTPTEWLKLQLTSLNSLAETRLQMSETQLYEAIALILSTYPQLTAADICLFIARVKIGHYGPFYGCIDPLKIMAFLRQYAAECRKGKSTAPQSPPPVISEAEERKAVTYEMYQEVCRRAAYGDPEAIRELQPPSAK